MRFHDSETQKLLRGTARAFLRDRYPPERLYALERGESRMTGEDLKAFAELGWLGLIVPESAGGSGVALLEAAVVIDEMGYAAVPAPVAVANIAAHLLSLAGAPGAQDHLPALVSGRRLYTVAESARRGRPPGSGAGPAPPSLSSGLVQGTLPLVPFAEDADFVLAPLVSPDRPVFGLIPLEGARREPVRTLDRRDCCHLHFDSTPGALILAAGDGAGALHERLDTLVTAFSLVQLAGMMQRVLEMTGEYISNRVQFGQPIAKFQAARHHAADLLLLTDTTRWTAYHALWALDRDPDNSTEVWLARHWAVRAAQQAFEITHLLHGGVGVGVEYPLHLYTQGMAALAVRAGTMDEMVSRTLEGLELA